MSSVNLKQIAERAGVSLATASRVLSGSDYPVKEELRQRVLQIAAALDYVPNANAQRLLRGRSSTVGVLVGDVSDPFFSGMVGGIHGVAGREGYMVTVVNTFREPTTELETLRRLRSQRVDILIIAGSGLDDAEYNENLAGSLRAFVQAGNAAVLIGHHELPDDVGVCRVHFDNREAAREVAEHLHQLGHRQIALLTGEAQLLSMHDRVRGFRDVFGDGLRTFEAGATRDGGHTATAHVLEAAPEVTAIATTADQLAIGVLAALRERGIAVPGEISVTGFNDIEISRDLVPSLTSARVPREEMGRAAMDLGLKALAGAPSDFEIRPTLVVRESSGQARGVTFG